MSGATNPESPLESSADEPWLNVPNSLSALRLVLTFVAAGLVSLGAYLPAFGVFVVAALTDAADGAIARALNQTTRLGRQLDPLIDKIMVIVLLVHLLPVFRSAWFPWFVTLVVTREILVQALRGAVEGRGVAFGARWSGKLKTLLQCLALGAILITLAYPSVAGLGLSRDVLLWGTAVVTAYSGGEYLLAAIRLLG